MKRITPDASAVRTVGGIHPDDVPEVAALYRACGYRGGIADADLTFAAKVDGTIVAAVRLCPEGGTKVLRGMQVLPGFRRQGIGSNLLRACVSHLDSGQCWCLPYAHLVSFYGAIGFTVVEEAALPHFLRERQAGYIASGIGTIAMSRAASGALPAGWIRDGSV